MFSGIVEECARVTGIVKEQENVHFTLQCSFVDELKIDQSVAHNGVCLTVVRIQDGCYTVTAMKETLLRSNLGQLQVESRSFESGRRGECGTFHDDERTVGRAYRAGARGLYGRVCVG